MVDIIIYSTSESWVKSIEYMLSSIDVVDNIHILDDMIYQIPVEEKYEESIIIIDCIFMNNKCNLETLEQMSMVINNPMILLVNESEIRNLKNKIEDLYAQIKEIILIPEGTNNFGLLGYKKLFGKAINSIMNRRDDHYINMKAIEEYLIEKTR